MAFKSIVRELKEMKEAVINMYRTGVETKHIAPSQSSSAPECSTSSAPPTESSSQSQWGANLPPDLLLNIIQRVDASATSWPSRRALVACASVCRYWREITKGFVKTPEQCGMLTFPISLKQPAPRDNPIQCFIKQDGDTSIYSLHLGLRPAEYGDRSKLLLSAKRIRRAKYVEFLISLAADDFSKTNNTYLGKLRTNFLGNKFMIFDGDYPHAAISYPLNVIRSKGPRQMQCTMHLIPMSSVKEGGTAPTPLEFTDYHNEHNFDREPLILKAKAPRWSQQQRSWVLNFNGRVTWPSVKNFQLIVDAEPWQNVPAGEEEEVILQFGKIGFQTFSMDYRYPLSAFQAFAICLSSFDTKPIWE